MMTLADGTRVASDSEEWRHHCEALTVLGMPTIGQRRAYLRGVLDDNNTHRDGVLQKRGPEALKRLEETILLIWYSQSPAS